MLHRKCQHLNDPECRAKVFSTVRLQLTGEDLPPEEWALCVLCTGYVIGRLNRMELKGQLP